MKNACLCVCLTLAASVVCAAVPLRWTVETSRVQPVQFDVLRGETIELAATLKSYGKPLAITQQPVLYWQTNGMADVWWSAAAAVVSNNILCAAFTPAMDPGASSVVGYIGVPGEIYRAAFQLRFRAAPGATPNALNLPRPVLDFKTVAVTNTAYSPFALAADMSQTRLPASPSPDDPDYGWIIDKWLRFNGYTHFYQPADFQQQVMFTDYVGFSGRVMVGDYDLKDALVEATSHISAPAATNIARAVVNSVYDEQMGITWRPVMHAGNLYYVAVTNANITEVE